MFRRLFVALFRRRRTVVSLRRTPKRGKRAELPYGYLGVLFQLLRERRGMTSAELGSLLDTHGSGVSAASYCKMEVGRNLPDDGRVFLRVYASVLQLTLDELQVVINLWALAVLTQEMGEELARESLRKLIPVQATA